MTRPFCVAPRCRSHGYHWPDCNRHRENCNEMTRCEGCCAGCQPRLAADGLRLCHYHRERIAEDAVAAAELHAELALALTAPDVAGERTSGSRDLSQLPNLRAVEARAEIRHTLVSWCKLISEERGICLPVDTPTALGAYLARHAEWLAASEYACEVSDELDELAHGRPRRIAYPTGARVFPVADCVYPGCEGTIKAILRRVDSLLPSALVCDADDEHTWPADQWLTLGRKLKRAA